MNKRAIAAGRLLAFGAFALTSPVALSNEIDEMRGAAALIVRVEGPLEAGDVSGYCNAMYGTADYQGYLARACESGVRNKIRKPQECTPEIAKAEADRTAALCAVMPAADFAAARIKWREARDGFIKGAAAKGIDGEQLLREEQANRR